MDLSSIRHLSAGVSCVLPAAMLQIGVRGTLAQWGHEPKASFDEAARLNSLGIPPSDQQSQAGRSCIEAVTSSFSFVMESARRYTADSRLAFPWQRLGFKEAE